MHDLVVDSVGKVTQLRSSQALYGLYEICHEVLAVRNLRSFEKHNGFYAEPMVLKNFQSILTQDKSLQSTLHYRQV